MHSLYEHNKLSIYINPFQLLTFPIVQGGIKGVVWTDVIQGVVMIDAMGFVIVKGTADLGGLTVVLERNRQFERLVGPE